MIPFIEETQLVGFINHAIVRFDDDLISLRFLKFLDSEAKAEHPMNWEEKSNKSVMTTFWGETAEARTRRQSRGTRIAGICDTTWITPEEGKYRGLWNSQGGNSTVAESAQKIVSLINN